MNDMPKDKELFASEAITVSIRSEFDSMFGKMEVTRTVSNATAHKIFKLLMKDKRIP